MPVQSPYDFLSTPCMLIDNERALSNITMMQKRADSLGLKLRPHIKTHRMPYFAKLQLDAGACGIACAKIGEAEVMSENGINDIFIANETKPLEVLIEYEVGEVRTGIVNDEQLIELVSAIQNSKHVVLKGIFSHEGHTYKADNLKDCCEKAKVAYQRTVRAAEIIRGMGVDIDTVSIGATPSVLNGEYFEGVTELRIGTYIFFDVGQSKAIGNFNHCAATVLASVISKPEKNRVVIDAGAKALVSQNRPTGICSTNGFGVVKGAENISVVSLFDEHGIFENSELFNEVEIGDKIEIIPSHVCPTVNLYDSVYLVEGGKVLEEIPVSCRGKSK